MIFLADHGYRAIAPDLRGYGDTTGVDVGYSDNFTTHHLVGDLVILIDAIAWIKKIYIGHDWGASISWQLCLFGA
ncbi:hypothetical protein Leryth_020435 [Lithospermum erythrorhizon]|nr:hypothetical protein Leryth_020435 [Lithospermum erythrorhizon]